MKLAYLATAVLVFPLMVAAQTNVTVAPRIESTRSGNGHCSGIFASGRLQSRRGALRRVLERSGLHRRIAPHRRAAQAIAGCHADPALGAHRWQRRCLKSLYPSGSLLEADQLDDAAYRQQVNNLAAATGKLVQDVGEMAVSPHRVLTLEQYRKLQTWQRAKRTAAQTAATCTSARITSAGNAPASGWRQAVIAQNVSGCPRPENRPA